MPDPRRPERLSVTHPVTGRVYPVPTGGSGEQPPPEPPDPPDPPDAPGPGDSPGNGGLPDDVEVLRREVEKVRREAAGYRTKLREAEPLAKRARDLEEAQKTEAQKLGDRAAAAEARADKAEAEMLRLTVGADKGLTPAQARRLVGATREELEADADEMIADFAPADPATPKPEAPRPPKEQLRPGATSAVEEPEESDPAKLAALVSRGF